MSARIATVILTVGTLVAGCGGSDQPSSQPPQPVTGTPSSSDWVTVGNGTGSPTATATKPLDHEPGPADVSTMEKGKQFDATPNFKYIGDVCTDHPCWLPLYPAPKLVQGTAVTQGYPTESYGLKKGDKVHVVCQVNGQWLQNSLTAGSTIWDMVVVPKGNVVDPSRLASTKDRRGYYAFGHDIWLGNTGWHGIPCR